MSTRKTGILDAGWPLSNVSRHPEASRLAAYFPHRPMPTTPPLDDDRSPCRARLKLWDLPARLHCPLIGTCLDASALRALTGKLDRRDTPVDNDYALHVRFVAAATKKNPASLAVQKSLEKRHADAVRRVARLRDRDALAQYWNEALEAGEVPGAMWALLTHYLCDESIRRQIFEDVHMLSHQLGAGQRADLCRYARTREALVRLQRRHDILIARARRRVDLRDRRIRSLEAALTAAERAGRRHAQTFDSMQREIETLQSTDNAALADRQARALAAGEVQLKTVIRERDECRETCRERSSQLDALRHKFDTLAAEFEALERVLARTLEDDGEDGVIREDDADLRGRQVLYVGGRHQLVDHYRALVERCNGRFSHHDGGRESGRARLESMMSAVDTIFYATDCVSHDACLRLKRFCKRHRKHYVMLHSSGLSSLARAIESLPA